MWNESEKTRDQNVSTYMQTPAQNISFLPLFGHDGKIEPGPRIDPIIWILAAISSRELIMVPRYGESDLYMCLATIYQLLTPLPFSEI